MQHFHAVEAANLRQSWLTIGNFDGVHLGHQDLIRRLVSGARAQAAVPAVLTFYPHPAVVLGRRSGPFYLTTPDERAEILGQLGVEVVVTVTFDHDLAATPAEDFVRRIHSRLNFTNLQIGHDFALGRGRAGDETALREIGGRLGFSVQAIDPLLMDGEVVSSSRVRAKVMEGDLPAANRLLGRRYALSGQVVPGDQRGRTIGIPTANIAADPDRLVPASGVYACRALLADESGAEQSYRAAVNIGVRPTFDGQSAVQHIEAHLLDFSGDLYGRVLRLEFVQRLRGEQRFGGIQELVAQIQRDIAATRELV